MRLRSFAAMALAMVAGTASSHASLTETATFAHAQRVSARTGVVTQFNPFASAHGTRGGGPVVVQNSLPPAAANVNFAASNPTANNMRYGDVYIPTSGGVIDQVGVSLFNSSSTASGTPTPITAGSVTCTFWDALTFTGIGTSTPLGSISATFDFSGANALAPGFFGLYVITDIALATNITIPATAVLMTYQWTLTGSTRHGFVSMAAPLVGTSGGTSVYQFGTPTPAEGFYNFGNPVLPGNAAMAWVIPAPGSLALLGLGGLVAARRRR